LEATDANESLEDAQAVAEDRSNKNFDQFETQENDLLEKSHRKFIKQSVLSTYKKCEANDEGDCSQKSKPEDLGPDTNTASANTTSLPTVVAYTPQQISSFITESVKEFIELFKTALFKFYRIKSYMRSQEDSFIELVTSRVLNSQVSSILVQASRDVQAEENELFSMATAQMALKDVAFWVNPSDSQFWLDDDRFDKYTALKQEL